MPPRNRRATVCRMVRSAFAVMRPIAVYSRPLEPRVSARPLYSPDPRLGPVPLLPRAARSPRARQASACALCHSRCFCLASTASSFAREAGRYNSGSTIWASSSARSPASFSSSCSWRYTAARSGDSRPRSAASSRRRCLRSAALSAVGASAPVAVPAPAGVQPCSAPPPPSTLLTPLFMARSGPPVASHRA